MRYGVHADYPTKITIYSGVASDIFSCMHTVEICIILELEVMMLGVLLASE